MQIDASKFILAMPWLQAWGWVLSLLMIQMLATSFKNCLPFSLISPRYYNIGQS